MLLSPYHYYILFISSIHQGESYQEVACWLVILWHIFERRRHSLVATVVYSFSKGSRIFLGLVPLKGRTDNPFIHLLFYSFYFWVIFSSMVHFLSAVYVIFFTIVSCDFPLARLYLCSNQIQLILEWLYHIPS